MNTPLAVLLIGIGATALMDLWGVARKPLFGMPLPSYAMMGRWLGHMGQGRFRHEAMGAASPIPGEGLIGWSAHYLIGIAFAALLIAIQGQGWLLAPTPGPALVLGLVTVAAPFLVMQPCMGAGIAASRTPNPASTRVHSLLNHAVFGLGLYLSGWALHAL
ncbi:DUF2938 domain-containing protein [Aeromonas bivalvium]|uniref:DUF2938 domain-containing protein n=1 Tax=Aeromonas bivalvium TaxID=440079 RepID=UPI0038D20D5A